ncbi:dihydrodipicolinate synthase family protein [Dyadobacter sandarakinus]|uniref:Dihydrodipicolinate synthase family protein n=1 Tax=Dyadobacter sandarakinus TaxID=2747268 RepID=A0ABX7I6B7_9BACT|nr:dihydrodipicolinate synthase family protein [Dyadobacter sandarakinus]QRR00546.1 dihydrodipicolinate synthase family protein [Dyadobacter sandarakinus]
MLIEDIKNLLFDGTVIPAHPLALNAALQLDEQKQRGLTRYYMASGAGGIAIGVHTTQFEIRDPAVNLFEKVLEITADEIAKADLKRPFIKVAGICGLTPQASREATIAAKLGYDMGLVSMAAFRNESESEIIAHVKTIAGIIPVFGFYLQTAIGGRAYSYDFWRQFAEIPNVYAIKIAAFNRYQTLDVVRAVAHSSRREEIALYTGNDDNIVADLLTPYRFNIDGQMVEKRFVGGLLGHWAVWTLSAVELLAAVKSTLAGPAADALNMLATNVAVTDMNAAIFDPAHGFHGCITGVHEVLRRQGLLDGIWTLNPAENLSPGQSEEITRVIEAYPHLVDDAFVAALLEKENSLT